MVCHGCGKEYATTTATCSMCRIVTQRCKCPVINTKAHSQQQRSKNWLPTTSSTTPNRKVTQNKHFFCKPKPGAEWAWCETSRVKRQTCTTERIKGRESSSFETFTRRAWLECSSTFWPSDLVDLCPQSRRREARGGKVLGND